MMTYTFKPVGTCSRQIDFELDDEGRVHNVHFTGGCNGNLQGIAALSEGKKAEEVIEVLSGIRCGFKPTSCPDQFSKALDGAIKEKSEE